MYQVGQLGLLVHNAVPDCVGWVRNQTMLGERLLLSGVGKEIVRIPGYGQLTTFHHAFIKHGDEFFDVIHQGGAKFNDWIKQVAQLNGRSVDDILAMIGKLPDGFR